MHKLLVPYFSPSILQIVLKITKISGLRDTWESIQLGLGLKSA